MACPFLFVSLHMWRRRTRRTARGSAKWSWVSWCLRLWSQRSNGRPQRSGRLWFGPSWSLWFVPYIGENHHPNWLRFFRFGTTSQLYEATKPRNIFGNSVVSAGSWKYEAERVRQRDCYFLSWLVLSTRPDQASVDWIGNFIVTIHDDLTWAWWFSIVTIVVQDLVPEDKVAMMRLLLSPLARDGCVDLGMSQGHPPLSLISLISYRCWTYLPRYRAAYGCWRIVAFSDHKQCQNLHLNRSQAILCDSHYINPRLNGRCSCWCVATFCNLNETLK